MDFLHDLAAWAWARHHNVLSWYVRPLFLIPFCYFAYRRSGAGIAVTLVALATSMFWFPAPQVASPAVLAALEAERDYLLGEWNLGKLLVALLVPLTFAALALAFWHRSFRWGVVVFNAMILIKIVWTGVYFEPDAFLAHLLPALIGLAACNLFFLWRLRQARQQSR